MAAYCSSFCRSREPGVGPLFGLLQYSFAGRKHRTDEADVMELAAVTDETMAAP